MKLGRDSSCLPPPHETEGRLDPPSYENLRPSTTFILRVWLLSVLVSDGSLFLVPHVAVFRVLEGCFKRHVVVEAQKVCWTAGKQ